MMIIKDMLCTLFRLMMTMRRKLSRYLGQDDWDGQENGQAPNTKDNNSEK